jgi:hypothetical protein
MEFVSQIRSEIATIKTLPSLEGPQTVDAKSAKKTVSIPTVRLSSIIILTEGGFPRAKTTGATLPAPQIIAPVK